MSRTLSLKSVKPLVVKSFLSVCIAVLSLVAPGSISAQTLVLSQVYGGGGNSGAPYTNDFIEIFNPGTTSVSLSGWSVQYASSSGTTWQVTTLSGSVAPGQYFLIQEAAGTGTATSLPTPDATGSINMSATTGKVALLNTTTALTSALGTGALSSGTMSTYGIIDFIGYGTGNTFLTAVAPAPSNTTAELRAGSGCTNAGNNSSDFSAVSPSPRNSASSPGFLISGGSGVGICTGSSTTLTATGGTTYTWSPSTGLSATTGSSVTANPSSATTYTITGTSGICVGASTVSVTVNAIPTISGGSGVAICSGSSTTLTGSGGTTYSWSPSTGLSATTGTSVTANPSSTTTYTVTGTTSGCSNTATVTVTVNSSPTISGGSNVGICSGSSTTLTASGGVTYSWSPSTGLSATTGTSVTANPTSTTTYTVTGTNASSCSNTSTVTVSVNSIPTISGGSGVAICSGSSTMLTASGGVTYSWSPSTALSATTGTSVTANPTSTTAYTVTGTSSAGCSNTGTVTVSVNALPTIGGGASVAICAGSSTTLTASGGDTYSWSPSTGLSSTVGSSVSANPSSTTTYTVTGIGSGCSNVATVTVTVTALPTVSAGSGIAICSGSPTTLTASGGTTYSWLPSTGLSATTGTSVTANPSSTTTYTVTGTTTGCSNTAIVAVTVNSIPSVGAGSGVAICAGSSTTLTASGGATYSWSPSTGLSATTGTSVSANPSSTIIYTVTGTTSGCSNVATVAVTVNSIPSISAGSGVSICAGSSTSLSASGGTTYSWSPSTGLSATTGTSVTANPTSTTTYTVTGTTSGCSSTASVSVTVNPLPVPGTITGTTTVTLGGTTSLSDGSSGGSWSSTNTSVATVGTAGLVTSVAVGSTIISYTVTNGCGTLAATVSVTVASPTFTRGNIVVLRAGDGSGTLSGTSAPIFAIEYSTSGSATGFSVALPTTTVSGVPPITMSGSATSEGQMTMSAERDRLVIEGYNAVAGTASIAGTSSATVPRELFAINSAGTYSLGASSTSAYSANNIRSGTASGSNFFSAGTPSGIQYLNSSTALSTAPTNTRVAQIFNGQLYFSASSSPYKGVMTMGTGIPTTSGQTATEINTTDAGSAYGFSISPDSTIMYIADDAAGLLKYTLSGGSYAFAYTVNATPVRGIAVDYSGSSPVIYATPATGTTITKITDAGSGSSSSTIATAPTNTVFRAVQFSPSCFASIAVSGSSSICSGTGTSVTITGNPTATVSYNINGGSTTTATIGVNGKVVLSTGTLTANTTYNLLSISTTACSSVTLSGSATVTVNPVPATITGTTNVCTGSTTTLSNTATGGVWTSSNTATATVGSANGIVSGVASGTVNITYTLPCGFVTAPVTVNTVPAAPASITGTLTVCVASTTTLGNTTSGGAWSSGSTSVATVGSTGIVSGASSGTATISYTLTNGCGNTSGTAIVTVNPLPTTPASITGTLNVCAGSTTTLNETSTGGTWSSVTTATGTVGTTGIVAGISAGTTTVSYTNTNSCGSAAASVIVTVNPLPATPASITGTLNVCAGSTTSLGETSTGGTWSSVTTGTGTVGTTGIVTGISAGTTTISYTNTNGCGSAAATAIVTVNPLPATPASITGTLNVCIGSTTTLNDGTTGGAWTSGATATATVGTSGIVTGVATGTATISYTASNSCGNASATAIVTVNTVPATPSSITGTLSVCVGSTTTLGDATAGGAWSSGDGTIATVGTSGTVTGVFSNTVTISYTATNSCGNTSTTAIVTVNPLPSSITGTANVCVAATTTLSDGGSGTWSSSDITKATVGSSSGIVSGVAFGTPVITYTLPTGCIATKVVTVNATSAGVITGSSNACIGGTNTLSDTVTGGVWSSSNTSFATINSASGIVTGVASGVDTIIYSVTNTCGANSAIFPVTVNIAPPSFTITPALVSLCPSSPAQLITAVGDTIIGSVTMTNNTTTFVEPENTADTSSVSVSGIPSGAVVTSISVAINVTAKSSGEQRDNIYNLRAPNGSIINLDNGKGSSVAGLGFANVSFSSAGTVAMSTTALTSGVSYIASLVSGAPTSAAFTPTSYRSNTTVWSSILSSAPNGQWTLITDNTFNATEDTLKSWSVTINYVINPTVAWSSVTGLYTNSGATTAYTGASASSVYALPTSSTSYTATATIGSCSRTATVPVTVNSTLYVPVITGANNLCPATTIALTDSTTGGVWTSSNTALATVGSSSGVVTGVAAGSPNITYTYTSGSCSGFATKAITVNALPTVSAITGTTNLCLSASPTATLTDATTGTTSWSSSNTAVATIGSSSGTVTGVTAGTSVITYTYNNGVCSNTTTTTLTVANSPTSVSVSPLLASLCPSSSAQMLVASGGIIPGSSTAASGTISFSIPNTAGGVTNSLTVSGVPTGATVTGISVNYNATESFDGDLELNLKAPNTSVINLFSSGTSNSGANFVNTTISSAGSTPIPNAGPGFPWTGTWAANASISPTVGSSTTPPTTSTWGALEAANPNGTWTLVGRTNFSGNTATLTSWSITIFYNYQASVTWSSATGLYTNTGATTAYTGSLTDTVYAKPSATITYTVTATNGACTNSANVNVDVNSTLYVPVVTGSSSVCAGSVIILADSIVGGVWTSSNTALATVASATGAVTGVAAGTPNITYTYNSGSCSGFATKTIAVNGLPTVAAIAGPGTVCSGTTINLTDATSGGSWTSGAPAVATIGSTGIVSPVSVGSATISYSFFNGTCTNIALATVNSLNTPSSVAVSPASSTICSSGPAAKLTATGGAVASSATFSTTSVTTFGPSVEGISPVTVSGIPTNATITGISVTFNASQFSGGWDADNIYNLEGANSHILNLVSLKGGSGSTQGFVNTTISSAGTTPIPATGAPYTGTYAGDTVLGTGATGYASDSTTWSSLFSTGSLNGTWNLLGAYTFTSGSSAIGSWSLTINYTTPAATTWSSATGLYTDSAATTAYTGSAANPVYALPSATSTYTVTAANGACTSTSTAVVSVNPSPSSITGSANVCVGFTSTLGSATTGGTWSSSDMTIATVGSTSGVATGVAVGAAAITYMVSTGCFTTAKVTVNPVPAAIAGTLNVCVAATTTLSDTGSGTWSSSNVSMATVGSATGVVTGASAGTPSITYTSAVGCIATIPVTVNPLPAAISGTTNVCIGSTTTLNDASGTGTWSSSNTSFATIGSGSGIVSGIAAGVPVITFVLPTGCMISTPVTVNSLPSSISGTLNVCVGLTTTLTDASSGGSWTSSNTSLATVGTSSGTVSGVASGNPVITYTLPTGCIATIVTTVNPLPSTISSTMNVCVGASTTLSDAISGGAWSSSNTSVTTIGSASGIVNGVALGSDTITYTLATGCYIIKPVTVNASPASITGTMILCQGATALLSNTTTGGAWSSGSTAIATVGTGGVVTGVSGGNPVISYSLSTGCSSTAVLTVNALPTAYTVTGGGGYCTGGSGVHIGLSGSDTGVSYQLFIGTSASGSSVAGTGAAIDFGLRSGAGSYSVVGTRTITSCGNNMTGSVTVTVNAFPTVYSISGGGSYCAGGTGVHIGMGFSNTGISYQLYNAGTTVGAAVAGTGGAFDFGPETLGGSYSVIATNVSTGCAITMSGSAAVTVNPLPTAYVESGGGTFCSGGSGVHVSLSNSTTGINYQLFNGSTIAGTSVPGTGTILDFGLQTSLGTYTITGTNPATGCIGSMTGSVTVTTNPLPTPVTMSGGGSYCAGGTGLAVGLFTSATGISYQLYLGGSAVGAPVSGTGSAVSFGAQTAAGSYTVIATNTSTGCTNNMTGAITVSVNPLPSVFTVTGGGSYCAGGTGVGVGLNASQTGVNYQLYIGTSTLGSAAPGTGSAISFGSSFTTAGAYTVVATNPTTGCTINLFGSASVAINPLPTAFAIGSSATSYCAGGSGVHITLGGSVSGVNYFLYNGTSLASAAPGLGAPIDFGAMLAGGTYTVVGVNTATLCQATMTGNVIVTVNALPAVFPVSGGGNYCSGATAPAIGLSGSTNGISYQLFKTGVATGSAVTGTGSPISFGATPTAGAYTIVATNTTTGCSSNMTGTATVGILPLPTGYLVTGGGGYCTGTTGVHIGLGASDIGVNYQLFNGSAIGGPVSGTGTALDFGAETATGTYTVIATNTSTSCTTTMSGSATVSVSGLPLAYPVSGGGNYCAGGTGMPVSLLNSATGVNYQLYLGTTAVGSAVTGTGSAIGFGSQTAAGTYNVLATAGTSGCTNVMTGSATIGITPLPVAFPTTGGGNYCAGGTGVHIGLSGSAIGVKYQLYNGTAPVTGDSVLGVGSAADFGAQTASGTYTVLATNPATGCTNTMSGSPSININLLPGLYTITGGGNFCSGGSGVHVGLSGSAIGVNYQLYAGSTPAGVPVAGTGIAIDFGLQTIGGSYTVVATNTTTGCTNTMTGIASVTVNTLPTPHIVTGGGNYCPGGTGIAVGINGSDAGISYQLYDGATPVGAAITGTGAPLSFGPQTAVGSYTVVAHTPGSGCTGSMTGSVTVGLSPLPTSYTVTGGGNYCPGGAGLHVGLSGSSLGVTYSLYNSSVATGLTIAGTGSAIDFGVQTVVGTYMIVATSAATTCSGNMSGAVTIAISPLPVAHAVIGGGGYCAGGAGLHIGLDGSNSGTTYQLYLGTSPVGSPEGGTGSVIDFGLQFAAGTYTVIGTNTATSCVNTMPGSQTITINSLPHAYAVTGGGNYCAGGAGSDISLSGSATGVNYQLFNSGSAIESPLAGTGAPIDFGTESGVGTYTIVASSTSTTCSNTMTGSAVVGISPAPTVYSAGGGGNYCAGGTGVHITLSGSGTGISYQLINGGAPAGSAIPGTGFALDFGLQTVAGSYTIVATNTSTTCTGNMSGTIPVAINPLPVSFTVSGSASNYCAGGAGVDITLGGSGLGVSYQLYNVGAMAGAPVSGTGSTVDFGDHTAGGTYTVVAVDPTTGCSRSMAGSAPITVNPLPPVFAVTGGGGYCSGGAGVHIGMSGSNIGVTYQLYNSGALAGSPVTGSGAALDFGLQTITGSYTVVATSVATGCTNNMAGTLPVSVNPLPAVYSVTGGGNYCSGSAGVHVGTLGSTPGTSYQLMRGTTLVGSPVSGTGFAVDLGLQTIAGSYTVVAINILTSCTNNMSGTATVSINPLPSSFSVTGGGNYCAGGAGPHVGLGGSNTGISYSLFNSGTAVGSALIGTGSPLDFGAEAAAGTYTVIATNTATSCAGNMSGSATIVVNPSPTVYNVVGGGSYCAGGIGVHVGVNNSTAGVHYQLYNGFTTMGVAVPSTGGPLDLGLQTAPGTYTVIATNASTACSNTMAGSAVVTVNPLAPTYVAVSTVAGDTVCSGSTVTFTPAPVNGGTSPSYEWSVNGSVVSAGASYSYVPSNGDVVGVAMTSSMACATPAVISGNVTMTVFANQAPSILVYANPGTIVCQGTAVNYTSSITYGGSTPTYSWVKNGIAVGSASTYSYVPANGDDISCVMTSDYRCRLSPTATSNHLHMEVDVPGTPTVSISAFPGLNIVSGQTLTLSATISNAGPTPSVQWFVNGNAVPGANSQIFTGSDFSDLDVVTCQVTSNGGCSGEQGSAAVTVHVRNNVGVQQVSSSVSDVQVIPNPNKGIFTVKGSLVASVGADVEVSLEVTDVLGQAIYHQKVLAHNGIINEQVQLGSNIANGMYLLNLRTETENKVFHMVIER